MFRQFHGVKSANRVIRGDVADTVPPASGVSDRSHKLQPHSIVVSQFEDVVAHEARRARKLDIEFPEVLGPETE